MQSEDVTCPVCIVRVDFIDGAYASLVVDGGVGEPQHDTFYFPRPWRDYLQWSAPRRENFARLLRVGNLVNITFDADGFLQEISATVETDFMSFLIIAGDDADSYFVPSEKAPREPTTMTTTTTVHVRKPMRVQIIFESHDSDTLYAKRLPEEKALPLTTEYLRRLVRLFPGDTECVGTNK